MKLDDVITINSIAKPWKKLLNRHFSDFHAKFWGKSLDDEEREWNNWQSNVDGDDDAIMDSSRGDRDEEEDGTVKSDVDGDNDFIPGSFELNVYPNPVLAEKEIWIRGEYIRFYDYREKTYGNCYSPVRILLMSGDVFWHDDAHQNKIR